MYHPLDAFLTMMRDPVRIPAYQRALAETVRPGDQVLDLGCGPGVMTFLALEAGAGHVIAIDTNPVVGVLRQVARDNGLADRVTVHQGNARTVDLPAVDVIVYDIRGILPVLGGNLALLDDVRRRCLKPDGRLIPQRDRIFVAPLSSAAAYREIDGWRGRFGAADYGSVAQWAANNLCKTAASPLDLLADGQPVFAVDYLNRPASRLAGRGSFTATRGGDCHGLLAWFEATLAPGVVFSTAPGGPHTVYGHAYFPLTVARPVSPGDRIDVDLSVAALDAKPVWSWSISIPSGPAACQEKHSSLLGQIFSREDLSRWRADAVPTLDADGACDRDILDLIDGRRSAEQIARAVTERHPQIFPRWEAALGRIAALSARGGRPGT
jgi:protein arginine N-methyltransferase 1